MVLDVDFSPRTSPSTGLDDPLAADPQQRIHPVAAQPVKDAVAVPPDEKRWFSGRAPRLRR
jgi:hypothetical protein